MTELTHDELKALCIRYKTYGDFGQTQTLAVVEGCLAVLGEVGEIRKEAHEIDEKERISEVLAALHGLIEDIADKEKICTECWCSYNGERCYCHPGYDE